VASDAAIETAIPAERAAALIADGAQAIDVRRPQEWSAGRIAGARQIEMNELTDAADSIQKARPVVFYCRSGNRSAMAAEAFRQAGFDAYSVDGGLQAWVANGMELDPIDGAVAERELGS
jgi:hydroxyacylglutathione hydrolase/adenylyltransferase/sulfurtransferase